MCQDCSRDFPLAVLCAHVGRCSVKVSNGFSGQMMYAGMHQRNRNIGLPPLSVTLPWLFDHSGPRPSRTTLGSAAIGAQEIPHLQEQSAHDANPADLKFVAIMGREAMEDVLTLSVDEALGNKRRPPL